MLFRSGAGTGSVSIEAAQYLIDGAVYAFEKNPEALSLIEENKLKFSSDNIYTIDGTEHFQDVDLMLFDKVIAFDHFSQKITLIVNMKLDDPDTGYNRAVLELERLRNLLINGARKEEPGGRMTGPVEQLFDENQYCGMVERAKHHKIGRASCRERV